MLQIVGKVQRPTLATELLGAAIAWWGLALPLRGEGYVTCGKDEPPNMSQCLFGFCYRMYKVFFLVSQPGTSQ